MTRAARAAALAGLTALAACEDKPKPPPSAPPSAASVAESLGVDAAAFDTSDPPAPAGDLKEELDRFVNVRACVEEKKNLDPLVADALRGIGYDTFLRDACRLLEATKDKKRETCDQIDASALRARCKVWVATAAQTPDACPLLFEGAPARGRAPSCVAVAGKDPRLCASEPRPSQRATCEAMARRDASRCDALPTGERAACARELLRWSNLLAPPLEGLPPLPAARGKLTVRGAPGTPDPTAPETDLGPELARGAVVVTARERARVELGSLGESEAARIAGALVKRPRVGLAVVIEPPGPGAKEPRAVLERLELELPGEPPIVVPPSKCDCRFTTARVGTTRGGEIALALTGTVTGAARTYQVSLDLGTFVRDVVADAPGGRALPPVHPRLGAGDAGR